MKKIFFLSLLTFLFFIGKAQEQSKIIIDTSGTAHPWNNLNVNNEHDNFQFAIVFDRTGGLRDSVFEKAVRKLNLLQPEFVMSVGEFDHLVWVSMTDTGPIIANLLLEGILDENIIDE